MASTLWPLQMFDPQANVKIVERRLPHWSQAGTVCFITWRTADSFPASVLRRWHADRDAWLRRHGIEPKAPGWRDQLQSLDRAPRIEFVKTFSDRWHRHLDSCHGACVLRDPDLSKVVAESLLKFDGERYELTDFVVMPNHVHLLAAFPDEDAMLAQCESWKRHTATQIHRKLGSSGRLWQQDGFDHLVRSNDQFEALRRYIAGNPDKARLKEGEFRRYSKAISR